MIWKLFKKFNKWLIRLAFSTKIILNKKDIQVESLNNVLQNCILVNSWSFCIWVCFKEWLKCIYWNLVGSIVQNSKRLEYLIPTIRMDLIKSKNVQAAAEFFLILINSISWVLR